MLQKNDMRLGLRSWHWIGCHTGTVYNEVNAHT